MALWGVLIDILKTAASHAAPHVARTAVDMARERINATTQKPVPDPVEALNQVLSNFDQRIANAEQRAAAAEEQVAAIEQAWVRKWESARIWIIVMLSWSGLMTVAVLYLLFLRK
jgi:ribosome-binding protein aMBF1 (putative translation factor)